MKTIETNPIMMEYEKLTRENATYFKVIFGKEISIEETYYDKYVNWLEINKAMLGTPITYVTTSSTAKPKEEGGKQ